MTQTAPASPLPTVERPEHLGASRSVAVSLVVAGLTGLLAAAVLLVEKVTLLENPFYVPSCSVNAVLSCGTIMTSDQAEVFGFPNPVLGVAAFPVVAAAGAALLAGARVRAWAWWGLLFGCLAGLVFVHWLIVQSAFVIGALCPYCMVAWVCTAVATVAVAAALAAAGRLPSALGRWAPSILVAWAGAVTLVLLVGLTLR